MASPSVSASDLADSLSRLTTSNDRHKLIVGVDYGTTFSGPGSMVFNVPCSRFAGIAFAMSHSSEVSDITVITDWPGPAIGVNEKVPSLIAYAHENKKLGSNVDAWGLLVEAGMINYSWTKLLLDKKALSRKHDDPTLEKASGDGILKTPRGKSADEVVADYLTHLYRHCMARLEKAMTLDVLNVTPIEFWFTMPAIWSDEAQHATRRAATKAGFGSRRIDEIYMIPEPEAAALSALKKTMTQYDDLLEVGLPDQVIEFCQGTNCS